MKLHQILTRYILLAGVFLLAVSFVTLAQAREIWLNPVEAGKRGVGNWGGVKFNKEVHFHWRVPNDFDISSPQSGTATLLVIGLKNQDFNYQFNINVAVNGELNDAALDTTIPLMVPLTAGTLTEIPVPAGLLPDTLMPGEYVALNLERVGKKKVKAIIVGMRYNYNPIILNLADLQAELAVLQNLFAGVSRSGDDIFFDNMNVHIRNGLGETDGVVDGTLTDPAVVNGLGNLIVGYNEADPISSDKTGSHNLVVGWRNNYSSAGGLVTGVRNTVSGIYASVSGGEDNTASGNGASVSGGQNNTASGEDSSVSGGGGNLASGLRSSVSGGQNNTANGRESSVSGGAENTASEFGSSVSGGIFNTASGTGSSVSGGESNNASDIRASVSGGFNNTANGQTSSVSGGQDNIASSEESSVSGGSNNTASATGASVSGGFINSASGGASSVSGGANHSVTGVNDWAAGSLFEDE